jgi:capsular exopolysaccharide synthesis family protein
VIALTSALPKEGKSTITFHTSIALAELGYRVLLVDVDLHKSTISKMCLSSELFLSEELDSLDGLSNALLESDQWQNLIKKSSKFKLDVLLSGAQSINSITLLNSPRFIRLIEEWKKEYDYVIFDTPPIVGISDTRLIATLVDGIVYVVGLNIAQRQMIDQAVDIISSIKTPVLGLAINRVDNHYSGYHQYYHYYQKPRNLPEEATSIQILKGSPK